MKVLNKKKEAKKEKGLGREVLKIKKQKMKISFVNVI